MEPILKFINLSQEEIEREADKMRLTELPKVAFMCGMRKASNMMLKKLLEHQNQTIENEKRQS